MEETDAALGHLTLIGTGHVFSIAEHVREAIIALQPEVVFVELDRGRYQALLARKNGKADQVQSGGSWIQRKLQSFQEGVAGMYGAEVGEEMLAAVEAAQILGIRCRFIDPPADQTVQKALKALTWKERLRGVAMLAGNGLRQLVPSKRQGKKELEEEIRKYQENPEATLAQLQQQFPSLYKAVIADRDAIMARHIRQGLAGISNGVAVVGDGHVPGISKRLADIHSTTYRLDDVREGRLPSPGNSAFHFSYHADIV